MYECIQINDPLTGKNNTIYNMIYLFNLNVYSYKIVILVPNFDGTHLVMQSRSIGMTLQNTAQLTLSLRPTHSKKCKVNSWYLFPVPNYVVT